MIEMVYNGKEPVEQGEVRIPKNIRQIGSNDSSKKVYIEDYVLTHLKKKPEKEENVRYGVLLGEVKKGKGNTYIFVKAMVEVFDIIENSLIFNDDIWSGIYKDIKKHFDKMSIVGWFVSVPYRVTDDMNGIKKIHLDNFAGNDKVCFLSDRTEKEDGFYIYEQGNLEKQPGYYIYYEKNEKMKKYVKNANNTKTTNQESTKKDNSVKQKKDERKINNIKLNEPLNDTKSNQKDNQKTVPAKNNVQQKSFRDLLKDDKQGEPVRQGRVAYGISGLLIVALLLSTVVMLNNYGELKNIKQTLSNFNMKQEAQAVNQILNSNNETTGAVESQSVSDTVTTEDIQTQETKKNRKKDKVSTNQVENNSSNSKETEAAVKSSYSGKYHTVASGQTLYDISMRYYGTSKMVDEIKEYNDIDDDYTIVEGQKILLP
ncbi:LysM peptidoglycan-binding domain-containing protein [uncultured Eubacterium sp.]|uniref:LysM peptidoglycan-binding domain-containing protein n=1 Tax=uncultured Eubacterium sp. TaxID=165185 RepID=UPI002670E75A|nr:LysM peptidoglycan-binding domain-containing protein [uncultured Eubacterium sp.]